MFSIPFVGNDLAAANFMLQSVEASSRVEMKSETGIIDDHPQPNSPIVSQIKVGPESIRTKCPQCGCIVNTRIQNDSSMQTHVVAVMLFPFCCCIPYYFPCCKNVHHYCPGCGQYLETFRR